MLGKTISTTSTGYSTKQIEGLVHRAYEGLQIEANTNVDKKRFIQKLQQMSKWSKCVKPLKQMAVAYNKEQLTKQIVDKNKQFIDAPIYKAFLALTRYGSKQIKHLLSQKDFYTILQIVSKSKHGRQIKEILKQQQVIVSYALNQSFKSQTSNSFQTSTATYREVQNMVQFNQSKIKEGDSSKLLGFINDLAQGRFPKCQQYIRTGTQQAKSCNILLNKYKQLDTKSIIYQRILKGMDTQTFHKQFKQYKDDEAFLQYIKKNQIGQQLKGYIQKLNGILKAQFPPEYYDTKSSYDFFMQQHKYRNLRELEKNNPTRRMIQELLQLGLKYVHQHHKTRKIVTNAIIRYKRRISTLQRNDKFVTLADLLKQFQEVINEPNTVKSLSKQQNEQRQNALVKSIQILNEDIQELRSENTRNCEQKQGLKVVIKQKQLQMDRIKQQFQSQIDKVGNQLKNAQQQIKQKQLELDRVNYQLKSIQQQIDTMIRSQRVNLQSNNLRFDSEHQKKDTYPINKYPQVSPNTDYFQKKQVNKLPTQQTKQEKQGLNQIKQQSKFSSSHQIFSKSEQQPQQSRLIFKQSSILNQDSLKNQMELQINQFLKSKIGKTMASTELLHSSQNTNKLNSKSLFKNHRVLFLCRTQHNKIVGGYVQNFNSASQTNNYTSGMIIATDPITNKLVSYKSQQNENVCCFKSSYMIFGTNQLRFELAQNLLSSHLGTNAIKKKKRFFEMEGISFQALSGSTNIQTKMKIFQIYAIQLQGQQVKQQVKIQVKKEKISERRSRIEQDGQQNQRKSTSLNKIITNTFGQSKIDKQTQKTNRHIVVDLDTITQQVNLSPKANKIPTVINDQSSKRIKQLQNDIERLNGIIEDMKGKLQQFDRQLQSKNKQEEQAKQQLRKKQEQNSQLIKQMKQKQQQIIKLKEQIQEKKKQIKNEQNLQQQQNQKKVANIKYQYSLQIDKAKRELDEKATELETSKAKYQQLAVLNNSLLTQKNALSLLNQQNINKLQQLQEKIINTQKQFRVKLYQIQEKDKTIFLLKNSLKENEKKMGQIKRMQESLNSLTYEMKQQNVKNSRKFFNGHTLNNLDKQELSMKTFIVQTIQKQIKKVIIDTRLLYRFDKLNKINFHHYFDDIPNIAFVGKGRNPKGQIRYVAGFIEEPSKAGLLSIKQGIIFALNNREYFMKNRRKETARALQYDQYYLNLGNSELRIKTGQEKIFSNFAIVNNFYDNRGKSVDALFGYGDRGRQIDVIQYQIFEVVFQQDRHNEKRTEQ